MIGQIQLRMVVDSLLVDTSAYLRMQQALKKIDESIRYESGGELGLAWDIVRFDITENKIAWRESNYGGKKMYIPTSAWAQKMNEKYDKENTSVQIIIHPSNWKDPDFVIGGINYFQQQILNPRLNWSVTSWKITIEHEMLHAFDNRAAEFEGVDFAKAMGVNSWDRDVVHRADSSGRQYNDFVEVYRRAINEIAIIYPYENMIVDLPKLTQITNELLLRDPIAGEEEAYVGREEDVVRAEVGALSERWDIINVVNAARNVKPL